MADKGHVKISRKAYEGDPFWTEEREFSKWEAWEWMIQEASWKDRRRVIGMKVIPLERGEFIASIRFLAEAWGWKRTKVHSFLKLLVEMGRIAGQRETPEGTVYVLVNYSYYQGVPDGEQTEKRTGSGTDSGTASGQRADSERTASGQTRSKKAGKASKAGKVSIARVLPQDWAPNDGHRAIAAQRGVDVEIEAAKMRDWSAAGGKARKDWDAAFRNWLRNADPPRNGNGKHTPEDDMFWTDPDEVIY